MLIAIDPSINETGWAFGDGELPAASGVIRTKGGTDADKLQDLHVELMDVIGRCLETLPEWVKVPDIRVVVEVPESFTYGRSCRHGKAMNAASLMKLSRAIGVILQTCRKNHARVEEAPASWKAGAGKRQVQAMTGCSNHNEADAVMLYRWAFFRQGGMGTGRQGEVSTTEIVKVGRVKRGRG